MSHKVIKYPYGIYCLILYKTWFGIPVPFLFKAMIFHSQDELLDAINKHVRSNKELTDVELRRKINQLKSELECAFKESRLRSYKAMDVVKK